MGVFTMELEKMNKTIRDNQQKQIEEIKAIEKRKRKEAEKKQQLKEYEKEYFKAVENDLKNAFEKCFERDGLAKAYINLCLLETRKEILKNIPETASEYDFINNNYEKILEQVKKRFENDQKAKNALQQIQAKAKQEQKERENKKTQILYKICSIIFSPLTLILFVIVLLVLGYYKFAAPILGG